MACASHRRHWQHASLVHAISASTGHSLAPCIKVDLATARWPPRHSTDAPVCTRAQTATGRQCCAKCIAHGGGTINRAIKDNAQLCNYLAIPIAARVAGGAAEGPRRQATLVTSARRHNHCTGKKSGQMETAQRADHVE